MTDEDLLGSDVRRVVGLHHALSRQVAEQTTQEHIERVLGRIQLSDYPMPPKLRGLERCAEALLEYRRIMFYRTMMSDPSYGAQRMADACGGILAVLEQENDPARPESLPRVDARNLDPDAFRKEFILRPHAVMLDNWGYDATALGLERMIEQFGDEMQPLIQLDGFVHLEGPLRDVVDKHAYLANSDRLLTRHPELLDGLKAAPFQKLAGFNYMSSQLFMGAAYAGSWAHFAATPNLFYMAEGEKRWTIIDPAFSYLTYPVVNPFDGYTALSWLDESDAERCPLYRFCPRFEVDLKPGDLLFNPRYWMHSVVNLTRTSVGVAVRWLDNERTTSLSPCALFDVARQLNPRRRELELRFFLATVDEDQAAWFEGHAHGRTYVYEPEAFARSFGVDPRDPMQKPNFWNPVPELAGTLPVRPR